MDKNDNAILDLIKDRNLAYLQGEIHAYANIANHTTDRNMIDFCTRCIQDLSNKIKELMEGN